MKEKKTYRDDTILMSPSDEVFDSVEMTRDWREINAMLESMCLHSVERYGVKNWDRARSNEEERRKLTKTAIYLLNWWTFGKYEAMPQSRRERVYKHVDRFIEIDWDPPKEFYPDEA